MGEYPGDYAGLFYGSDNLQGAAAVRAVFDVDIEDSLEQARPAHTRRGAMRCYFWLTLSAASALFFSANVLMSPSIPDLLTSSANEAR
jgi:hypothetical protein